MKVCQFVADCTSKALIEAMRTSSCLEGLWRCLDRQFPSENVHQSEKILAAINLNEIIGSKTYLKKEGNNCQGEGKSSVYTR